MVNSTAPFDWVENVCYISWMMGIISFSFFFFPFRPYRPLYDTLVLTHLLLHVVASYQNKIYSVGGVVSFKGIPDQIEVTGMSNTQVR